MAEGGAPRPDLAGTLKVLPQYGSLGTTRPFGPGEYVMNSNGGWSSEYTVTVEDPRQSGRFMVVPSLWLRNGKPTLLSEDQAAETAVNSGLAFPSFDNEKLAETYSNEREAKWQKVPVGRSDLQPPLWQKADEFERIGPISADTGGFQRIEARTTAGGLAAAAGRGLAPIAAGAGLGAAAGAPFAGVGAIPGALAGAGAAGLAEVAVPGYNFIARHTGLPESPSPQSATDRLLDMLGVKRPGTTAEKVTEDIAGTLGAAATGAMPTPRKSFATTAGRLAGNEEKAVALRDALDKAVPGGDERLLSRLTNRLVDVGIGGELLHFLGTGDLGAVVRALGMTGAREVYQWSRSPTRRLDQLEKIIERQQRSVDPFRTAP